MTSDKSQCQDFFFFFLTQVRQSVPSRVDLFSPSNPSYLICVGRLRMWLNAWQLLDTGGQPAWDFESRAWGRKKGVKWLDPDVVACLDGLGTELCGDRGQSVGLSQIS